MAESSYPIAYWTELESLTPEAWKIQLMKNLDGKLAYRAFKDATQIGDFLTGESRKLLITFDEPKVQILYALNHGATLARALESWRSATELLLDLKDSSPNQLILSSNNVVQSAPQSVLVYLGIDNMPNHLRSATHTPPDPGHNFQVVTIALTFGRWAETYNRILEQSVGMSERTVETDPISPLEEIRLSTLRARELAKANSELLDQNALLLDQLHRAEEALQTTIPEKLELAAREESTDGTSTGQSQQPIYTEERIRILTAELEKERGRITKFQRKIKQLRELLNAEMRERSTPGRTPPASH